MMMRKNKIVRFIKYLFNLYRFLHNKIYTK